MMMIFYLFLQKQYVYAFNGLLVTCVRVTVMMIMIFYLFLQKQQIRVSMLSLYHR